MNKQQQSVSRSADAKRKMSISSCYRNLCKAVITRAVLDVADEAQRMLDEDLKGLSDEDKFRALASFLYRGVGKKFSIDVIWLDYLGLDVEEFLRKFPMYSVTDYRAFPNLPSGMARSRSTVYICLKPDLNAQVWRGRILPAIPVPTQYSGVVSYDVRDELPEDRRSYVSVKQFPLIVGDSQKTADLINLILQRSSR